MGQQRQHKRKCPSSDCLLSYCRLPQTALSHASDADQGAASLNYQMRDQSLALQALDRKVRVVHQP